MFYVSSSFLTCCLSRERSAPSTGGVILRFLPRDWPKFTTGNSKIYTLIKTAYTRHFTIIFSWMHTVNTKKNRSGPVRTGEAKSFEYTSHNLSLCDEQWMGGADCECAHVTVYLFVRSRENGCMHIRHICVYRHCVHRYIGFLFLPFF